ncbi:hypothetical protein NA57DRAFT_60020 [Rhizodiscina lignyota]|uniref:Uncharacterized protein n=1 Tax=Rhizodiscina lignyota TaxID=1504668 RepID=A0A9P4I5C9_9PEZI|nr:hypothetical protein NA57DRAFT_60020 [Rhizodiscina lignyota]
MAKKFSRPQIRATARKAKEKIKNLFQLNKKDPRASILATPEENEEYLNQHLSCFGALPVEDEHDLPIQTQHAPTTTTSNIEAAQHDLATQIAKHFGGVVDWSSVNAAHQNNGVDAQQVEVDPTLKEFVEEQNILNILDSYKAIYEPENAANAGSDVSSGEDVKEEVFEFEETSTTRIDADIPIVENANDIDASNVENTGLDNVENTYLDSFENTPSGIVDNTALVPPTTRITPHSTAPASNQAKTVLLGKSKRTRSSKLPRPLQSVSDSAPSSFRSLSEAGISSLVAVFKSVPVVGAVLNSVKKNIASTPEPRTPPVTKHNITRTHKHWKQHTTKDDSSNSKYRGFLEPPQLSFRNEHPTSKSDLYNRIETLKETHANELAKINVQHNEERDRIEALQHRNAELVNKNSLLEYRIRKLASTSPPTVQEQSSPETTANCFVKSDDHGSLPQDPQEQAHISRTNQAREKLGHEILLNHLTASICNSSEPPILYDIANLTPYMRPGEQIGLDRYVEEKEQDLVTPKVEQLEADGIAVFDFGNGPAEQATVNGLDTDMLEVAPSNATESPESKHSWTSSQGQANSLSTRKTTPPTHGIKGPGDPEYDALYLEWLTDKMTDLTGRNWELSYKTQKYEAMIQHRDVQFQELNQYADSLEAECKVLKEDLETRDAGLARVNPDSSAQEKIYRDSLRRLRCQIELLEQSPNVKITKPYLDAVREDIATKVEAQYEQLFSKACANLDAEYDEDVRRLDQYEQSWKHQLEILKTEKNLLESQLRGLGIEPLTNNPELLRSTTPTDPPPAHLEVVAESSDMALQRALKEQEIKPVVQTSEADVIPESAGNGEHGQGENHVNEHATEAIDAMPEEHNGEVGSAGPEDAEPEDAELGGDLSEIDNYDSDHDKAESAESDDDQPGSPSSGEPHRDGSSSEPEHGNNGDDMTPDSPVTEPDSEPDMGPVSEEVHKLKKQHEQTLEDLEVKYWGQIYHLKDEIADLEDEKEIDENRIKELENRLAEAENQKKQAKKEHDDALDKQDCELSGEIYDLKDRVNDLLIEKECDEGTVVKYEARIATLEQNGTFTRLREKLKASNNANKILLDEIKELKLKAENMREQNISLTVANQKYADPHAADRVKTLQLAAFDFNAAAANVAKHMSFPDGNWANVSTVISMEYLQLWQQVSPILFPGANKQQSNTMYGQGSYLHLDARQKLMVQTFVKLSKELFDVTVQHSATMLSSMEIAKKTWEEQHKYAQRDIYEAKMNNEKLKLQIKTFEADSKRQQREINGLRDRHNEMAQALYDAQQYVKFGENKITQLESLNEVASNRITTLDDLSKAQTGMIDSLSADLLKRTADAGWDEEPQKVMQIILTAQTDLTDNIRNLLNDTHSESSVNTIQSLIFDVKEESRWREQALEAEVVIKKKDNLIKALNYEIEQLEDHISECILSVNSAEKKAKNLEFQNVRYKKLYDWVKKFETTTISEDWLANWKSMTFTYQEQIDEATRLTGVVTQLNESIKQWSENQKTQDDWIAKIHSNAQADRIERQQQARIADRLMQELVNKCGYGTEDVNTIAKQVLDEMDEEKLLPLTEAVDFNGQPSMNASYMSMVKRGAQEQGGWDARNDFARKARHYIADAGDEATENETADPLAQMTKDELRELQEDLAFQQQRQLQAMEGAE